MNLKSWILLIAIIITLSISIPSIVKTNKSIKEIEKYYEKRRGTKDTKTK